MNVKVLVSDEKDSRKRLSVTKDFKKGEVIYKEEPVVVALDIDLQGKGTHCTHCLRVVDQDTAVKPENDRLKSVYCSKDCEAKSKAQSDNLLFGLEPVLPAELDSGLGRLTQGERDKAQTKFVSHLESQGKLAPLLVARFVARQVAIETGKMNPHKPTSSPADLHALVDGEDDYGLYDHMERLRFIEANPTEEDTKVLCDVLATALPGLDKSLEGQHSKYLGKMNYNAFGVVFENGRDDKPKTSERPEDQERTRTPYGTSRQVGSGFYAVSSYIGHSCSPSATPSFPSGTSEIAIVAARDLKEGDELTISYVDCNVNEGETSEEATRRRRYELARGWRFKCECSRCASEVTPGDNEGHLGVEADESKVDDVAVHERGEQPQPAEASWIPVGPALD
ncbi:hypothetical protein NLI96_g2584 [Meripilus lineatus]|uniref:SET domain-containing protein n=1 Tax=Meripilus lineatus TaxID=2056292 RepID=A0AAD5VAH2_9APHY|nr:hypothetical protein NLI96_g2584 [Physisporinus lineatus]